MCCQRLRLCFFFSSLVKPLGQQVGRSGAGSMPLHDLAVGCATIDSLQAGRLRWSVQSDVHLCQGYGGRFLRFACAVEWCLSEACWTARTTASSGRVNPDPILGRATAARLHQRSMRICWMAATAAFQGVLTLTLFVRPVYPTLGRSSTVRLRRCSRRACWMATMWPR